MPQCLHDRMSNSSRRPRAPWPLVAVELLVLALAGLLLFYRFPIAGAALVIALGVPVFIVAILRLYLTMRPAMVSKPSARDQQILMTVPPLVGCAVVAVSTSIGVTRLQMLTFVLLALAVGYMIALVLIRLTRLA